MSTVNVAINKTDKSIQVQHFGDAWCFTEAFKEQSSRIERVFENPDLVYVLSGVHEYVFTLGNSLKTKNTDAVLEGFVQTDRGGQVMHHGPGQLTIYPIFKLQKYFSGPKEYIKFLFDECIEHFKDKHKIKLFCKNNGLWNEEDKKVGYVGLRVKKGVVYHGLSLNYNVDLSAFLKHSPCDISGDQAGNLVLNEEVDLSAEAQILTDRIITRLTLKKA